MSLGKVARVLAVLAACQVSLLPGRLPGQNISDDSFFERRRRQAIADQIGTQEHLRWLAGLPSRLSSGGPPYSLESIYSGLAFAPGPPTPWKTDVFEPWPRVPGDLYGRQFDNPWPQPLGHRVTPLGPNGYIYEPVYEPDPAWLEAQPLPPLAPRESLPPAFPRSLIPGVSPLIEELPAPLAVPELREF